MHVSLYALLFLSKLFVREVRQMWAFSLLSMANKTHYYYMHPLPVSRIEVKPQISISFNLTKIIHVVFIHGHCSTLYTYGSTNRVSVKTNKKMVYHALDIHMPQFPPRHSHSLSSHYTKCGFCLLGFPSWPFPQSLPTVTPILPSGIHYWLCVCDRWMINMNMTVFWHTSNRSAWPLSPLGWQEGATLHDKEHSEICRLFIPDNGKRK